MKNLCLFSMMLVAGAFGAQAQPHLTFAYDAAGNQVVRQYCGGNCAPANRLASPMGVVEGSLPDGLALYPNPTLGQVYLRWSGAGDHPLVSITVLDPAGREVPLQLAKGANTATFSLRGLPSGLYVARFGFADGAMMIKRIAKH